MADDHYSDSTTTHDDRQDSSASTSTSASGQVRVATRSDAMTTMKATILHMAQRRKDRQTGVHDEANDSDNATT